ncbi:MAG: ankyrin repeat domain-containing protein [Clostridia bacterium]|nr:ankyrin repeat domain-containing protein [Clostridia bacterium]
MALVRKFDLKDYLLFGKVDFDYIKKETIKKWNDVGLKDADIRDFYTEIANPSQIFALIKKAHSPFCNNKKLLNYINSGMPVGGECMAFTDKKGNKFMYPSFLHQAIKKGDTERVELLLAAGADIVSCPESGFKDTFSYLINEGDLNTYALVLSFMDKIPEKHWVFGALYKFYESGNPNAAIAANMLCQKLISKNIDEKQYIKDSVEYFNKLIVSGDMKYNGEQNPNNTAKIEEQM